MKSRINYFQLVLCAIAMYPALIIAQQEPLRVKKPKLYGEFGHFTFSAEQFNLSGLNQSLSAHNYGKVNTISPSYGGGGFFILNNFVLGGGGAWMMKSETHNAENQVELKGGYGYFNLGYVLLSGKRSLFYPTIGLGGGGYDMVIRKKNNTADFSSYLDTPEGVISLNAGGWMTNVQLCYQYFFSRNSMDGFCLGIKAGYKYAPYSWRMKINDTAVNDSPDINMNGLYITLTLGGGGITGK